MLFPGSIEGKAEYVGKVISSGGLESCVWIGWNYSSVRCKVMNRIHNLRELGHEVLEASIKGPDGMVWAIRDLRGVDHG